MSDLKITPSHAAPRLRSQARKGVPPQEADVGTRLDVPATRHSPRGTEPQAGATAMPVSTPGGPAGDTRAGGGRRRLFPSKLSGYGIASGIAPDARAALDTPAEPGQRATDPITGAPTLPAAADTRNSAALLAVSIEQAITRAMNQATSGQGSTERGRPGALRLSSVPVSSERRARQVSRGEGPQVTFRPGRQTVSAIIMAAAIIACADGQVSDAERRSLLSFLRREGILERNGRAASAAAFEQAVSLAVTLGLDEACAAADLFRDLADRPGAPMVAHAATLVALADGVGWPQEVALLEVIRDRLGLGGGSHPDPRDVMH